MRISASILVFLLLIISLALTSCKEKDSIAPSISILAPLNGAVYSVFDTIFVNITVIDETDLSAVSVKLANADFISIGTSSTININPNTNMGSAQLVIDDKLIDTGDFYIVVIASDGTNEQREFRKIKIIGLPKERRAIYFSSTGGTGNDVISKVDSLFQNVTIWLQADQDVRRICVNSLKDRLTLIGHFSTGISSYNLNFGSMVWADNVFPVAQTERYLDLFCSENDVFTAIYDREVKAYTVSGALIMKQQTGNYRPETIFANGKYLVVEMELVGDNDHFIFVYNKDTRVLLWQLDVPMDVVSICALQNDEVLLFGNENDNAKVLHYDIGDNAYWQPRQLPEGKLMNAVKMEGQKFAIAHENGLYSYTYSPNYLNLIRAGTLYQNLSFDVDNGVIIGATQNMLEAIAPAGQLLNTIVHSDSITSIDIHYTR